ncbi:FlgB family protein [Qingshengfaniella alkalisoli]|uniref:FlgB family protein n=1 Tax=Qingshengfaniella alkalisoli TaxID=2599296 RepID=A0A5B8IZW6_9RHOB|nr:FlgB family protein [Qingshengfaniella alkalisoli]QDY70158.1 FlgB family protein [Qingshengfaniella alkalisoli]
MSKLGSGISLSVSSQTVSKRIIVKPRLRSFEGETPMHQGLEIFRLASGLASHASARQSAITRNIANADTNGYVSKDLRPFSQLAESDRGRLKSTRDGHIGAGKGMADGQILVPSALDAAPNGNQVSLENEMIKASEARQSHQLALSVYRSGLDMLRASIGRR